MIERILILAPRGRDAAVAEQVVRRAGLVPTICADLAALRQALEHDSGAVLVTEEALQGEGVAPILDWCEHQPPWSDLPIIVLATRQLGSRTAAASALLQQLGNVILLERPINAETLASATHSALRGRRRQYQARGLLAERETNSARLRDLNATLEQRVAERAQELEQARETLAFALDSAGMGTWDLDLATDLSRRTPQHDHIFGYAGLLPEWGRSDFLRHVVPDDQTGAASAFDGAAQSGTMDLECRIRRADGAIRWIAVQGRVHYDDRNSPVRMAGVVMDITERRFTEDALRQAQKMEAIGQLTGGVAHDFNNLLTVIVGGLDMVIRRPENTERVVRLAEAAMTAARRGEQLTQQLLAFSRRQMLRPQTLNPNRLLMDFEALARRAVGETVTLAFELDPGIDPIRIDAAQFESAVLNLIVNARDAMPEGGGITVRSRNVRRTTEITADHDLPPGPYVGISVADTGTGIDAPTLARAFEPFFTTKDVGKGSGLGLSQVYGFTRSAGGDVIIKSALGSGTTVTMFFPRSADIATEETHVSPSKMPLRRATSGETVLLVEDDPQVLGMAVESLEELQYRVIVARNGREALGHLNGTARIDILFSDVVMPGGISGGQLAEQARRIRPELKILLTSGYVGELESRHAISDDVAVLNKPYRRDELAHKLRLVLNAE